MSAPRVFRGCVAVLFLLRSITISLVLTTFSSRWFLPGHSTKSLTSALYSSSRPPLIYLATAESSENFCRWADSELYWESEAYRVNRKADSTIPLWCPYITHHYIRQRSANTDKLCQVVSNPGEREWVNHHCLQCLSLQEWLDGVECTGEIKVGDSHCAARLIQMWVSSLQQADDGIFHPQTGLVSKLQRVKRRSHLFISSYPLPEKEYLNMQPFCSRGCYKYRWGQGRLFTSIVSSNCQQTPGTFLNLHISMYA